MLEDTLTKILTHRRQATIATIIISVALIIVWLFATFAILLVDVTTKDSTILANNNSSIKVSSGYSTTPSITIGSISIIPRTTKTITVSAGEYIKSQTKISIPWHGIAHTSIELQRDKNATKIAYHNTSSTTCATYSSNSDKLLSYNCSDPTSLQYYSTENTPWSNIAVINDMAYSTTDIKPYKGGVIGITHVEATDASPPGDIIAVSEDGKIHPFQAPRTISPETLQGARVFTDTKDPNNPLFIITDTKGFIHVGTPTSDNKSVSYKTIAPPKDYENNYSQTVCSLVGDRAFCYHGEMTIGDRPKDYERTAVDSITSLSLTGDTSDNYPVNSTIPVHELYSTLDGQILARSHKRLYLLDKTNDTYTAETISHNIDSATTGDNIYFIQGRGVFQVDLQTLDSRQIFYSPHINPKAVYWVDGKLFIIGNVKDNGTTTFAYSLANDDNTTPGKRIIDTFPMTLKTPDIDVVDFVPGKILTSIKTSYRKNAPTPQQALDQADITTKQELATRELESLGFTPESYALVFTY